LYEPGGVPFGRYATICVLVYEYRTRLTLLSVTVGAVFPKLLPFTVIFAGETVKSAVALMRTGAPAKARVVHSRRASTVRMTADRRRGMTSSPNET
jgi:hypothetical protein